MDWLQRLKSRVTRSTFYLPLIALLLILIVVVIVAVIVIQKSGREKKFPEPDRIECPGLTKENCAKLSCIYDEVDYGPACYMKKDSFGYQVSKVINESTGKTFELQSTAPETPYGTSIPNVTFVMTYITENIFRFQFKDADNVRYEVPVQEDFPLLKNASASVDTSKLSYEISHSQESQTFYFAIKRKEDEDEVYLWDTRIGALMLSDKYLQIGSYLPSENIYGLGEHVHNSLKHKMDFKSWPMFARDRPPNVNYAQPNLYGVHPFYTCLEKSGKSHGVLFLNSNAMEVSFMPFPAISYRTIGGILDFFIFVGDNPEHVIQLYTSLIGRPMMPPYWSLGFHLSRYGYEKISELKDTINRTKMAKIPQACQFLDIDHMDKNKDFTFDNLYFNGLPSFIEETKNNDSLKWIIILDPAIAVEDNYQPYLNGINKSIFVKRSPDWNSSIFPADLQKFDVVVGKVWPESYTVFPDFFLEETKEWWKDNIIKYHDTIKFDGLWIDMNEPANFGTNEENPEYCKILHEGNKCWSLKCPIGVYEDPPYNPLFSSGTPRLSEKTICMESVQNVPGDKKYFHYDVHSLYGWSQTQPTLEAAQTATGTRSLVITRSSYPSSGRHSGHWLGDNTSSYEDMRRSIIGMLEFNLFGIPFVGADVCGFFEDTSKDLCKRWMQLGAFYPFYRNHNGLAQTPQDPVALGPDVQEASRKAIERRIALNPYLYTLLFRAHVDGNTVVRPVFHEFYNDSNTWDMDAQFMWGKSMLITPILSENRKSVSVYLPKGEWWHFHEEKSWLEPYSERYVIDGQADEYTPLHIRGGLILPYAVYKMGVYPENSTSLPFQLYVFPENDEASGELFVDDGISVGTIENRSYALFDFNYSKCRLNFTHRARRNFKGRVPFLESIVVFKSRGIAKVPGAQNFTTDTKLNVSVINVYIEITAIPEIAWEDANGNCNMSP